ncbi:MAG TPA: alpha/beta hydrolase [Chthoniobacterales bacterium]|nr:alpha/beta hydrolase [Chthoniobacterales bacterium]
MFRVFVLVFTFIAMALGAEAAGESRFAELEGMRVHYTAYGKGEPAVVLVHGWNCDESVWEKQVPALARKTHLITIDLPGHGESDKPERQYTMDLHARAVAAVLEHAGAGSAVLVGHSNGTPVIRQFYRLHPEKTRALVIVDGALRPFGDANFMEKFIAPLRGRDYAETTRRFVNGMTAPMKNESAREEVRAMMLRGAQHVAVSEMESLREPALWAEDRIEVPVLMLLARQPAWTAEYETFVRGFVPDLDYRIWDGVSHFLMLDKPEEFNEAVLEFLKKKELLKK